MRSSIVDLVRQRQADRPGGGTLHLTLTGDMMEQAALQAGEEHIPRVHEALEKLSAVDARMAQVVELRHFAGLSDAEVASALDVGERTVRREWEPARLLLAKALKSRHGALAGGAMAKAKRDFELGPGDWVTLRRLLDEALERPQSDQRATSISGIVQSRLTAPAAPVLVMRSVATTSAVKLPQLSGPGPSDVPLTPPPE